MNVRLISAALALGASVCLFGACSDDDETGSGGTGPGTSSSTGNGGAGAQGGGGAGAQGGGGGGVDCEAVCGQLYDCGAEGDNCEFSGEPAEKATFVGDETGGCFATCTGQPILANLVDPTDCEGTITSIKGVSADFKAACENGISGAGGAGGGGVGGGGGAGGN